MRTSHLAAGAVLLGVLGLAACGSSSTPSASDQSVNPTAAEVNPPGDIPDNQVFVRFDYTAGGYSVKVPEGWARSEQAGAITFTDKLNAVTLDATATTSAPTVASATADEVPAIESSQTNVTMGDVTSVQRAGTSAVLISYTRDGTPDPVTNKSVREAVERYEYFKDGTEAIVTLSGPKGADNVDPWRIVSDSLQWD